MSPVTTRFAVAAVAPFRLDLSVWALRRRPTNEVDRWDGHTYRRAIRVADTVADLAVVAAGEPESPRLEVAVIGDAAVDRTRARVETTARLNRLLGFDVDLKDFLRRGDRDPDLRSLVRRFRGVKPPRFPSLFESLANAVACQQLSLDVGIELLNRFAAAHGRPAPGNCAGVYAFPEARDLVGVDPDALRGLGFSRQKSRALIEIADHIHRGELRADAIAALDDPDATARLQELHGIGRWSAEYVLLRGLGRLAVFPGDDVGARNNLQRRFGLEQPLDYDAVGRVTSRWRPYSGLVYFHLLLATIDDAGWLEEATPDGAVSAAQVLADNDRETPTS